MHLSKSWALMCDPAPSKHESLGTDCGTEVSCDAVVFSRITQDPLRAAVRQPSGFVLPLPEGFDPELAQLAHPSDRTMRTDARGDLCPSASIGDGAWLIRHVGHTTVVALTRRVDLDPAATPDARATIDGRTAFAEQVTVFLPTVDWALAAPDLFQQIVDWVRNDTIWARRRNTPRRPKLFRSRECNAVEGDVCPTERKLFSGSDETITDTLHQLLEKLDMTARATECLAAGYRHRVSLADRQIYEVGQFDIGMAMVSAGLVSNDALLACRTSAVQTAKRLSISAAPDLATLFERIANDLPQLITAAAYCSNALSGAHRLPTYCIEHGLITTRVPQSILILLDIALDCTDYSTQLGRQLANMYGGYLRSLLDDLVFLPTDLADVLSWLEHGPVLFGAVQGKTQPYRGNRVLATMIAVEARHPAAFRRLARNIAIIHTYLGFLA